MGKLQKLGRALMEGVAVLPVAALLTGIGYWIDPAGWGATNPVAAFLIQAGLAILGNLGIIFAVAVAYGLSKDKNGAAALSGMVGFFVITKLLNPATIAQFKGVSVDAIDAAQGFAKIDNGNVFVGIIVGIVASMLYNKFHDKKLPDAFAFFSGRRMVPILTSFAAIIVSAVLYFIWPVVYSGLVSFGTTISGLGAVGAGIYAFFNRLLIPTGLHHALNAVFWTPLIGINDIGNFWSNTASTLPGITTGMYQAGFFPIMMFGLPGAALAMYTTAKKENKKVVGSLLFAGVVATFVTGVTEPLEFAFMFLAPVLYVVHALLTGLSVFIAASMKWIAGFGFSAGFIDMFLSTKMPLATKWYMLILQGVVFFFIYYFVFVFFIKTFKLKTPGREDKEDMNEGMELSKETDFTEIAKVVLLGLGGADNIESVEYCATRLRVVVKDRLLVDEKKIKSTKVSGVIRPSKNGVQVIVGPQVQFVHDEFVKMI